MKPPFDTWTIFLGGLYVILVGSIVGSLALLALRIWIDNQ